MSTALRNVVKKVPGAEAAYRKVQSPRRGEKQRDADSLSQQMQVLLLSQYRAQFRVGQAPFESIRESGFRVYSQFEEDGILLYVLAAIGMGSRTVVEIGCGAGVENMSSNLILNHGFTGYLFDGSADNVAAARAFYRSSKDCLLLQPEVIQAWITRENVNDVLRRAGAEGEVDVLSLDIDGNDWHIWNAIDVIRPRLCVFETHDIIPDHLSLTVPYDRDFDTWSQAAGQQDFCSASLLAMKRLSESKGYRLIGGHRHGFNVFFLRNDLAADLLPEVSIADVHDNPWTRRGQAERWPLVKDLGWVEV